MHESMSGCYLGKQWLSNGNVRVVVILINTTNIQVIGIYIVVIIDTMTQ